MYLARDLSKSRQILTIFVTSLTYFLLVACDDDSTSSSSQEVVSDQGALDTDQEMTMSSSDMSDALLDLGAQDMDTSSMSDDMNVDEDLGGGPSQPETPSFAINWPIFERPIDPA